MQIDWQTIVSLVAIFGSIAGVIVSLKKVPIEIKEKEYDAAYTVTQSVDILLDPLNKRIECLEAENSKMKETIRRLDEENSKMEFKVVRMESRISELEKERDSIRQERSEIIIGAHKLVGQIKSISPDTEPIYRPPDK